MTEEEKNETGKVTRREFLKDAGLVVGGAAIGSTVLLAACECPETVTETTTETVIETVSKYVCPIDGMEFDTFAELQAHFEAEHPTEPAIEGLGIIIVNGKNHYLMLEPEWTLAEVIRDKLGLIGTKMGCNRGECGACTVIADGRAVYACTMLAVEAEGVNIQTIEGLATGGTLSPVQQAFKDNDTWQCGYCTPGFIMAATALLDENSNPTLDDVREALSGHICSCGDTKKVVETVLTV